MRLLLGHHHGATVRPGRGCPVFVHLFIYTFIIILHAYVKTHVCTYLDLQFYSVYLYRCIYLYTDTEIRMNTYVYMCIYIYAFIYICMFANK